MQDGSGHIEVELTSHEPARADAEPPPHEPDGDGGGDGGSDGGQARRINPLADERFRIVLAAAATGVVALLLGWMLGRAGDTADGEIAGDGAAAEADGSTATTARATTTTVLPSEVLPAVDDDAAVDVALSPEDALLEVAPPVTEPEDGPAVEAASIALDERIAGLPVRLVGFESGGRMAELDLATGTRTRTDLEIGFTDGPGAIVGDDWALVPRLTGQSLSLLSADGVEPSALGQPWNLFWVPGTDLFWRASDEAASPAPTTYEQVTLDGQPTGLTLDVPGFVSAADPLGGLVVQEAGGVYSIDASGAALLGRGDLVGLSANRVVFRQCDETLTCGLVQLDRTSGTTRRVPDHETAEIEAVNAVVFFPRAPSQASLSPDGRWCSITSFDETGPMLHAIDLETGEWHSVAADYWGPSNVVWTPDSRFALFLDGRGQPNAFDPVNDERFQIAEDMTSWNSLATRPSAPVDVAVEG